MLSFAEPLTAGQLFDATQVPLRGAAAEALVARIRASFPKETDFKIARHAPLIEKDLVAFIIEAPDAKVVRVAGMLNHSRGFDLVPLDVTGIWLRVERIPTDTKFAFNFEVDGKKLGARTVEMPDWAYPPESKQLPDRKYGKSVPLNFRSEVFANDRTGSIYVPAAYDPKIPAALMVFQDGDAYAKEHVGTVVDNLIAANQMPVTILVLLNPGMNDDKRSNRSVEYDTLSNRYATFLEKDVLPRVTKDYNIKTDPMSRAIGGASSGGICAFTVAWERPDLFGRVCSHIGSFTNIRGGHKYPDLVRKAPKKPIRIFLQDGTNDLINQYGDWWQGNEAMHAALKEKGYSVEFLKDRGFHAYWSAGRVLPESLRKTWAD
jgi:enterochelin esterase family protein